MGHETSKMELSQHATLQNYACSPMSAVSSVSYNVAWTEWSKTPILVGSFYPYNERSWATFLSETLPSDLMDDFAAAWNVSRSKLIERLDRNYRVNPISFTDVMLDLFDYSSYSGPVCWPKAHLGSLVTGYHSTLGSLANLVVPEQSLYGTWSVKTFPGAPKTEFRDGETYCISPRDPYYNEVGAAITHEMCQWTSFKTWKAERNMQDADDIFMSYSHPFIKAFARSFKKAYSCSAIQGCLPWVFRGEAWVPPDMWRMQEKVVQLFRMRSHFCIMLGIGEPPDGFITLNTYSKVR
ncbi:hypothetical protein GQ602_007014 [Ophiocordyceps camponoti-floridani]|uniref:Uncharacterized protein n=1 Tax=Ophiocordyceps camponoti-floridani TaxID=2030778 RepID=A0A8H4VAF7_9HYPO|nr:hypothetical protein GQ602_007014 [Ophiocordyceps camponoti-floridani]